MRALASCLCALFGRHIGARGGRLLPGCGASKVGRSPSPRRPSLGHAAGARCPFPVGAKAAGVGTHHQTRSACPCELALRAVGAARGRLPGGGGRPLPGCGASGVGCSPSPSRPSIGQAARARCAFSVGAGVWPWGPVTDPTTRARARWLCALWGLWGFARCGGGTRAPRVGGVLPAFGASGVGRSPSPHGPSLGRAAGARYQLVGAVCGCGGPVFLGTCSRAAVRRVLCALLGFAAPGCLAAWHLSLCLGCGRWRASLACLVALHWCAVPRPVRSLSVLRSAFPSPWCLPPPRGLPPPHLLGGYAGHVEAGREPGSGDCSWPLPRQGRWARSASYPFGAPRWGCPWRVPPASVSGCVRCVGLACVDAVTDTSGCPYLPSFEGGIGQCTGAVSCGRRHLPFRVVGRHARVPHVCACACSCWLGGAPASRARFGVPHLSFGHFLFLLCSACSGLGSPLPSFFLLFLLLFSLLFVSPPALAPWLLAPPLSLAFCAFRRHVPLALALCIFSCPPPLLSFFVTCSAWPPLVCRAPPLSLALALMFSCFRPRVSWALALCGFPPLLLFVFFCPPLPCCVRCALCCPLLLCAVLRVVLWLPASHCCGLLRVVGSSFGLLSVCCAVPCPAVCCCYVLCRVFGCFVTLCCSRCGLLSRLGVLCCVPGCCAAPHCLVLCCGVLDCFFLPCLVLPPAVSCPRALSVALGCCAFRPCVLPCFSVLCALRGVCFALVCWCVMLFAAVLCPVCVLACRAVRCAGVVRLHRAVCLVCAVSGTWCRGACCVLWSSAVWCCAALPGV